MVADRGCLALHLAAARDGHDHLAQVVFTEAAAAAIATHGVLLGTAILAAAMLLVANPRLRLEHEVRRHVVAQPFAAGFDADFLTVLEDVAVVPAETAGAVLALADQRACASSQSAAMIATGRLAVLANLHADSLRQEGPRQ